MTHRIKGASVAEENRIFHKGRRTMPRMKRDSKGRFLKKSGKKTRRSRSKKRR
jgi:hypothetical protein